MSPYIDFPNVKDSAEFEPLPEGEYACEFFKIEKARTSKGDEMWKMQLRVINGPHEGRIIFDNLVFSEKSKNRAKLIAKRSGCDVEKAGSFEPENLLGKTIYVTTFIETYEGKDRSKVPFDGYREMGGEGHVVSKKAPVNDDIPF